MKKYKIYVWVLIVSSLIVISTLYVYSYQKQKSPFDPDKFYPVVLVLDGDTFTVKKDNKVVTIRMLGINTPETVDPRRPEECFGAESSKETKKLLIGEKVRFTLSPKREVKDKYGRYLAYVYREDGIFVNEYLLRLGYAREYTYGYAYSFQKNFRKIEHEAKIREYGLWGRCNLGRI